MQKPMFSLWLIVFWALVACNQQVSPSTLANKATKPSKDTTNLITKDPMINKDNETWRKELTPEQYRVLREKGTERPYTGKYYQFEEVGTYLCAACKHPLFRSTQKYHSGCGWPSFYSELESANILKHTDSSHGMVRTEILCPNCEGHLGHIFDDGPPPTGTRYCVNSVSLEFVKDK